MGIQDIGVKAFLAQRLAATPPARSLLRLAFSFPTSLAENKKEDLSFLGSIGVIKEWGENGRNVSQPKEYEFALKNKLFSGGVQFPWSWMETDQTGLIMERVNDLAGRREQFWQRLLADLINNAETSTDTLDDVAYFSNSHEKYSTFDNLIGTTAASAGAPTALETADAVYECFTKLLSLLDDNGEPANEDMDTLGIACGTDIGGAVMQAALQDQLDTGAGTLDNPLRGLKSAGISIVPMVSPRITTTGKMSVFNLTRHQMEGNGEQVQAGSKPLLLMRNEELSDVSSKGTEANSEFRHDTRRVEYALSEVGNVGYGRPWEGVRYSFN